ncbi:MAG: hypothetical protein KY475_10815 [Planctomycetes bacterium]|nr:hypothetical protein [Planctomycetota bacterium]
MNLILVSIVATLAAPQGPQWMDNYGQALQTARAARKPLLVVLDTAPPSDERVRSAAHRAADPLLRPYVLCRIDVSTPYGKKMAAAFQAKSFPYTAVIDNTGSVILARRQGVLTEAAWNNLLITYQSGQRRSVSPPMISFPQQCFT